MRDITSSRALKDLVMTMFTPCPGGSAAGSLNLINHFVNAVESALWRMPLEAVLGEGSLQDIFTASALSAVANATCGFAASHIGALSHPGGSSAGGIAPPIAVLLHGAVGAGMCAIQGKDILSGAVGAMVGEVSGMIYNRVAMAGMGRDDPRRAEAIRRGTDVARLTGIAVAGIGGLDASAASCAAANAAANNSFGLVRALATPQGRAALTTVAGATGGAIQNGLAPSQEPDSSSEIPYGDASTSAPSSSSSTQRIQDYTTCFADYELARVQTGPRYTPEMPGPNTGSVLYVAPPAPAPRAPGVYEQLRDLPRSMGMTPAPLHLPLPGFTPHTARPSILATPRHEPSVIPLWTPGYFCRPSVQTTPGELGTPNLPPLYMAKKSLAPKKKSASSSSKKKGSGSGGDEPGLPKIPPVFPGSGKKKKSASSSSDPREERAHKGSSGPVEAPKTLEAFPKAVRTQSKRYVQGGGVMRRRWEDKKYIYEWDSRHGNVEKYTKRGEHLGEFCHKTGEQLKPRNPQYDFKP